MLTFLLQAALCDPTEASPIFRTRFRFNDTDRLQSRVPAMPKARVTTISGPPLLSAEERLFWLGHSHTHLRHLTRVSTTKSRLAHNSFYYVNKRKHSIYIILYYYN